MPFVITANNARKDRSVERATDIFTPARNNVKDATGLAREKGTGIQTLYSAQRALRRIAGSGELMGRVIDIYAGLFGALPLNANAENGVDHFKFHPSLYNEREAFYQAIKSVAIVAEDLLHEAHYEYHFVPRISPHSKAESMPKFDLEVSDEVRALMDKAPALQPVYMTMHEACHLVAHALRAARENASAYGRLSSVYMGLNGRGENYGPKGMWAVPVALLGPHSGRLDVTEYILDTEPTVAVAICDAVNMALQQLWLKVTTPNPEGKGKIEVDLRMTNAYEIHAPVVNVYSAAARKAIDGYGYSDLRFPALVMESLKESAVAPKSEGIDREFWSKSISTRYKSSRRVHNVLMADLHLNEGKDKRLIQHRTAACGIAMREAAFDLRLRAEVDEARVRYMKANARKVKPKNLDALRESWVAATSKLEANRGRTSSFAISETQGARINAVVNAYKNDLPVVSDAGASFVAYSTPYGHVCLWHAEFLQALSMCENKGTLLNDAEFAHLLRSYACLQMTDSEEGEYYVSLLTVLSISKPVSVVYNPDYNFTHRATQKETP